MSTRRLLVILVFVDEVEVDWHCLIEDIVVLAVWHACDIYVGSAVVDVHYVIDDVCCFLFRLWTSWYGFGVNFLCLRELRLLVFCFVCIVVGIVCVHVDVFASGLSCRLTSLCLR